MQKEMTRNEFWQSLFDRVARHLLRQNAKSINIYTGAVRLFGTVQRSAIMGHSPHGNLSAIGSLLTGVDYSESTDPHATKVDLRLVNAVLESLGRPQLVHLTDLIELEDGDSSGFDFRAFLIELEEIHDTEPVAQWPLALNNFALRWLLKTGVLIENKEDLPESVSQAVDNLPIEGRNVKFKVPMADQPTEGPDHEHYEESDTAIVWPEPIGARTRYMDSTTAEWSMCSVNHARALIGGAYEVDYVYSGADIQLMLEAK